MHTEIAYGPTGAKLALMNGQRLKKAFVALPAGAAAVYNSSGLEYYRHADWLGSSRLVSTPSRTVSGDTSYSPFGVPYAGTGTVAASFTGKNQDTASSLYDFPAREYGQVVALWPSPDPLDTGAFNLSNPQTLNLYAYVGNEPMSAVDPLGLRMNCGEYTSSIGGDVVSSSSGCTWQSAPSIGCYQMFIDGVYVGISCGTQLVVGKGNGTYGGSGEAGGAAPSPAAPQTPTSTCTISNGRTTAPGPRQATGPGAFGLYPSSHPGMVAVDPWALGLFGPGTNALLAPYTSQITFSFSPTPNLPSGFPTTFTLGDIVGPASVRAGGSNFNGLYDFDIYGLPSLAAADAATSQPVAVTVTFPSSLPINCGGPIADPVPLNPGIASNQQNSNGALSASQNVHFQRRPFSPSHHALRSGRASLWARARGNR